MSKLDRAVVAFVLLILALSILGGHRPYYGRRPMPVPPVTTAPAPPPAERVRRPPLAGPEPQDPLTLVKTEDVPEGKIVLGTAFSVEADGVWITARHVASAYCEKLAVVVGRRAIPATMAFVDPEADLTVLKTGEGAPAAPLATDPPQTGETGVSFGYPTNVLGATRDTLMGRSRMQLSGRLAGVAPTLTWAEAARFPDSLSTLQGMSGGPMFDAGGRVVGTVVAASERRGRVITVAPEVLTEVEDTTGLFGPGPAPVEEVVENERLDQIAEALSANSRIARVFCWPRR
jgi:hypothetical protein